MKFEYLETIPNHHPTRPYRIIVTTQEFTCLCPGKPDQPDFASLKIVYTPQEKILELRSLKYYLYSYRNDEIYHEDSTNKILDDLVKACSPQKMTIIADWNIRGGLQTRVIVRYPD